MLKVRGSISAKTGIPPASATEFAVAANEKDGTMTSSPALIPAAINPRWSADVPELTAMQCLPSTYFENSSSNALTSGPWAIMPLRRTRSTAARSSSPMIGLAAGIMVIGELLAAGAFLLNNPMVYSVSEVSGESSSS